MKAGKMTKKSYRNTLTILNDTLKRCTMTNAQLRMNDRKKFFRLFSN